ncbi:fatty acid desaturase family protein [Actinocorallia populi]|uniref:fatty acid desaturase family protein n=1 Tax=Actinocorallia populi TaxID=2079200 RepID=UPI000D08DA31|nr:acyl-CoA desaturase [Actinocorallia populi]
MTTTELPPVHASTKGSDFTPLARRVRESGLMRRRTGYYTASIACNVLGTAAVWVGVALTGSWWSVLLAVPAALLAARTGFLGHDAGHKQIASSARTNRRLGLLLGDLMLGMSHGWWNAKHNLHHAHPNHAERDPDVGAGALVWTPEQAAERHGALNWLSRNQAWLFFPMLTLEGLSLKVSSIRDLKNRDPRDRWIEGGLLAAHLVGYLALAFLLMPPAVALVFIAVHQAVLGVHLGCAFAPNHKGMPMPGPDDDWDHLRRQVLTSRNIRGGRLTDWFLGGLNYQVEHHLFPGLPRPALREVQPMVREHCAKLGLPYTETGLVASYAQALRYLDSVA